MTQSRHEPPPPKLTLANKLLIASQVVEKLENLSKDDIAAILEAVKLALGDREDG